MLQCDACEFRAETREQLAGHRSGHVRRGEVAKRRPRTEFCETCNVRRQGHHCILTTPFEQFCDRRKRQIVVQQAGRACELCGFNQTRPDGKHILQVDHVDGDHQNWERSNLRCLCPNCHALHSEKFMFYGRRHTGDMTRFNTRSKISP